MDTTVQLKPEAYYLLRRPLLPVNELFSINARLAEDPTVLRDLMRERFADPLLNEAIYIASPELHQELEKFIQGELTDDAKMTSSLYKYLSRMSTRCTPYGLFAGCSTGRVSDATRISYDKVILRKQSRLDMIYVCELAGSILEDNAIKKSLRYLPNNSLYSIGDSFRYIEYKSHNKKRHYTISSFRKSPYLDLVLDKTKPGLAYNDIISLIHQYDSTLSMSEVDGFVEQLIRDQILISELEPTITGDIYFDYLADRLRSTENHSLGTHLQTVRDHLTQGGTDHFKAAHTLINEHFVKTGSKDLIQTDLFFEHEHNTISQTTVDTITQQITSLFKLATKNHSAELDAFKKAFSERFEEQEIPLLLALDVESGVGYGTQQGKEDLLPLLDGIKPPTTKKTRTTTWDPFTNMVNRIYERSKLSPEPVVELTDEDLALLADPADLKTHIPGSFFAFGTLLATDARAVDENRFRFLLSSCSGPSCANLLGRFCHGDATLLAEVKKSLERDEPDQPGAVYAEIAHLPEARTGNVLMRPHLRHYEIPFLGKSSADPQNQIPVGELMVSVRNGKVVLRSTTLNKLVIPRMSTAHNFSVGLPIYRFLCDLQREDVYNGFYWRWENLSNEVFLPRVVYKNIIVSKAAWKVFASDIPGFSEKQGITLSSIKDFLAVKNIPRHVCLTEHDNELLLDLFTEPGLRILIHQLQKKGLARLSEFLSPPELCFLKGSGSDVFTNEMVLPMSNPLFKKRMVPLAPTQRNPVKRTFVPGEEWLYFKFYGGTKGIDRILVDKIRPIIDELISREEISAWFFLRYTDPKHHIRLRLRIPPEKKHAIVNIISDFQQALMPELKQQLLHKIQLDTYERELERYGHDYIEETENIFHHDSQATINVLNLLDGESGEIYRWLLAMRGLDMFLDGFGLHLGEKKELMHQLSTAFFQEFNGDKQLSGQVNEKYRAEGRIIRSILDQREDEKNEITEAVEIFAQRDHALHPIIKRIESGLGGSLFHSSRGVALLSSYIHMNMNRFFLTKPRLHEFTVYYLLHKHYTSAIAIQKNTAAQKPILA